MKKLILFTLVALCSCLLLAQSEEQAQAVPQDQPQVEPQANPQAQAKDMNLKRIHFPKAFIHAGQEYPAGDYWMVLTVKDDQSLFSVRNAQKEQLFEELAIVKPRSGGRSGSAFRVNEELMRDKEYFRVKVTTPSRWLLGYFLIKK
jgi:hypothetical protein